MGRFFKDNKFDFAILGMACLWGICEIGGIIGIDDPVFACIIGFAMVLAFSPLRKGRESENKNVRREALHYAVLVTLATLCAVCIVGLLRHKDFEPSAIGMALFCVIVQSAYYLVKSWWLWRRKK